MNDDNSKKYNSESKASELVKDWGENRTPTAYSKTGIAAMILVIISIVFALTAIMSQFTLMRSFAEENQWRPFTQQQRMEIEGARSFDFDFVSVVLAIAGAVLGLLAAGNNYDKLGKPALILAATRVLIFPFAETYFFALYFRELL